MTRFGILFVAAISVLAGAADAFAQAGPVAPCTPGTAPVPATVPPYGAPGAAPNFLVWNNIDPAQTARCLGPIAGKMEVVIALAGKFRGPATADGIAAKFGAASKTVGLRYWSISDGDWRVLVDDSSAVTGVDGDTPRRDFTAAEVMSGKTLYFSQDDTRSTSTNIYGFTAVEHAPDRLVVDVANRRPIKLLILTLFPAEGLQWRYFLTRLEVPRDDGTALWGYYVVSIARSVPLSGYERSFVNRAATAFRFYAGLPDNAEPPLAP